MADAATVVSSLAASVVHTFRKVDADGDGVITTKEIGFLLCSLDPLRWTKKNVQALFKVIDTNHDGFLTYEEFLAWILRSGDGLDSARRCLTAESGWDVVTPSVHAQSARVDKGRLLIFFDVDGVLNTKDEVFQASEEDESEEKDIELMNLPHYLLQAQQELVDDRVQKRTPLADSIRDIERRWGVRLNRGCLRRLRRLLASFDEFIPGCEFKVNRARLVFSGTWRLSKEQTDFIRAALIECGIDTKALTGSSASLAQASRGEEVLHYVAEAIASCPDGVAGWVVVDSDQNSLAALGEEHKLQTSEIDGFDTDIAQRARTTLVSQDAAWRASRKLSPPRYSRGFDPRQDIKTLAPWAEDQLGRRDGPSDPRRSVTTKSATGSDDIDIARTDLSRSGSRGSDVMKAGRGDMESARERRRRLSRKVVTPGKSEQRSDQGQGSAESQSVSPRTQPNSSDSTCQIPSDYVPNQESKPLGRVSAQRKNREDDSRSSSKRSSTSIVMTDAPRFHSSPLPPPLPRLCRRPRSGTTVSSVASASASVQLSPPRSSRKESRDARDLRHSRRRFSKGSSETDTSSGDETTPGACARVPKGPPLRPKKRLSVVSGRGSARLRKEWHLEDTSAAASSSISDHSN